MAGQESIRDIWSTYFKTTHVNSFFFLTKKAVIFVIDSTDKENQLLSKAELFNLLANEVIDQRELILATGRFHFFGFCE